MMPSPFIPAKTRLELAVPAPVGQRHEQIVKVVSSLVGQGLSAEAVFAELRSKYDATVTDKEIAGVIQWATKQSFTPCAPRFQHQQAVTAKVSPPRVIDPAANICKFLGDFAAAEADLWEASPWRPLENWRFDSLMFLAGMYHTGELLNIVTDYAVDENGKANPSGYGLTLERDAMMRHIRDKGTPQNEAGAWLRMNPVDGNGVADANVTAYRFALIEFDAVPMELQVSLLARLPLPVNAILTSGGRSAHAWVRVNAKDTDSYRAKVCELLELLKPFGVDQANKNPSRLSRLAGAQRTIGAQGDGQQRLLYLAPDRAASQPIFKGQT
jgi:hypothetical protein